MEIANLKKKLWNKNYVLLSKEISDLQKNMKKFSSVQACEENGKAKKTLTRSTIFSDQYLKLSKKQIPILIIKLTFLEDRRI